GGGREGGGGGWGGWEGGGWLLAFSAASSAAMGVPPRQVSTSSAGSYCVMPASAERSSWRAACTGRPRPRFEPWPTISSGVSSATACATAATTSSAVVGFISGKGGEPRRDRDGNRCRNDSAPFYRHARA